MSGSLVLSQGKPQKFPQRKRTIFTDDQLKALNSMFSRNPYPDHHLKKEMAAKMNMDPMVLQVWFKNHRAKLKKLNYGIHAARPQLFPREVAKVRAKVSPGKTEVVERSSPSSPTTPPTPPPPPPPHTLPMLPTPGALHAALGPALVYTHGATPAYQLRVCPMHEGHRGGHRVIHFGCCEDSSIYCLHPISASPSTYPSRLPAPKPCGEGRR
ncbi:divergent paired-related homeobox [Dipodomys spectabilis]|uniref:divergent paired-related homeobox n=1 Tax=Dipodomys spectabilis TaxID=105255 RepID=UPI001C540085|nr:divergent paired-related homeobox [Dipodomys spectabilis]